MTKKTEKDNDLFQGLKALSETAFPKECPACGRVFHTSDDFINKSESIIDSSGLKSSMDDDEKPIVELFRNCPCGSTLMDCFSDRRDLSEKGIKRRKIFGNLMSILTKKGLSDNDARQELLAIVRGGQTNLFARLGIKIVNK